MGQAGYKDRARSRAAERKEKDTITLAEGSNTLRILPTPKSKTTPEVFYEYNIHQDVGANKVYLRCGTEIGDEKHSKCWLCTKKIPDLKKQGMDERAAKLAPQTRLALQVAVVDDEGNFGKSKVWHPSGKTANSLLTQILGSKKRNYEHPEKGFNITIERTGTKFKDTRYGAIEPDDEPTKVPSSIVKGLKPFSELRAIPKYNEELQKAAYAGEDVTQFFKTGKGKKKKDESDDYDEDVDNVLSSSESGSSSESTSSSGSESESSSASESESSSESESESASESSSASGSASASESEEEAPKKRRKKK